MKIKRRKEARRGEFVKRYRGILVIKIIVKRNYPGNKRNIFDYNLTNRIMKPSSIFSNQQQVVKSSVPTTIMALSAGLVGMFMQKPEENNEGQYAIVKADEQHIMKYISVISGCVGMLSKGTVLGNTLMALKITYSIYMYVRKGNEIVQTARNGYNAVSYVLSLPYSGIKRTGGLITGRPVKFITGGAGGYSGYEIGQQFHNTSNIIYLHGEPRLISKEAMNVIEQTRQTKQVTGIDFQNMVEISSRPIDMDKSLLEKGSDIINKVSSEIQINSVVKPEEISQLYVEEQVQLMDLVSYVNNLPDISSSFLGKIVLIFGLVGISYLTYVNKETAAFVAVSLKDSFKGFFGL